MVVLTACLFAIFGQYRTGASHSYSAVFDDASRLRLGDTVRVAGIRVGTVRDVSLRSDKKVLVKFDADRNVVLTTGTRAEVRYLNLTGDRYLELVEQPGAPTTNLPGGGQIPVERTAPALDLDLLLGGLKPVISGLNPHDVNALTAALVQTFQGEGGTLNSLLSKTTSFSNTLADNDQTVQQLIDHVNVVVGTMSTESDQFSSALDQLQKLMAGLSAERDPIGSAINALDRGTASLAGLLNKARPPLSGTVDQLNRMAPLIDDEKDRIDIALQKLPENYRKLTRLGAYGGWIPYYLCELSLRVSDLQYRTVVIPIKKQEGGRCAEPDA